MIFRRGDEGMRWVSGMAVVLMLLALLIGCAKRSVSRPPGSATLPASLEGTTTGEGLAAPATPPIDPAVVLDEIQRRQGALDLARESYDRLEAVPEKEAIGSWILALEGQISILDEIRSNLEGWPETESAADKAVMTRDLAGRLLACIAMTPMEPSRPALSPDARDDTLTWESLRTAYERGNCVEVLEQYDAYAAAAQESTAPVEVRVMRAVCLSRAGKYSEAVQVLEPLLRSRTQLLDTQYLHYLLANWLFEESLLEQAGEAYRSVVDGAKERDQWAELAKLRIDQIRLQRGELLSPEPGETLRGSDTEPILAGIPPADARPEGGTQSRSPLPERGARWEPKMQPTTPSGDASVASMHQLHDAKLLEGKQFIDNEQYEEAVIAYQTLLGTEYDTLAQEGIQLAQDLYAEQHRREAASLVLKAHEDSDMASRKGLLVQALRMLQDINVRYPGNKYAAKVQQNIKDVVEQIQGMDPSFDPYGPTGITREEDPRAKVISQ